MGHIFYSINSIWQSFTEEIIGAVARDLAHPALRLPTKKATLSEKCVAQYILFLSKQYEQNRLGTLSDQFKTIIDTKYTNQGVIF